MLEIIEKWTVKRRDGRGTRSRCKAKCSCGNMGEYEYDNIRSGNTTRCVVCAKEARRRLGLSKKTHGLASKSKKEGGKIYYTWQAMKRRCQNPNDKRYKDYGGRGIKVCAEWQLFAQFRADMGDPPTDSHTIERIDYNLDYCNSNCRWATPKEQANNKRSNRFISVNGVSKTLQQWADETRIKRETIARRINSGWEPERAINTPARKFVKNQ
jgi:hypothetical protein